MNPRDYSSPLLLTDHKIVALSVPWPLVFGLCVLKLGWWRLGFRNIMDTRWPRDSPYCHSALREKTWVALLFLSLWLWRSGGNVGDAWRELAPRGQTAKQMENFGRVVLFSHSVTLLFSAILAVRCYRCTIQLKTFAQKWYTLW